jgi:Dolichyl-phosphate-mannose-protein mannosyltransferase
MIPPSAETGRTSRSVDRTTAVLRVATLFSATGYLVLFIALVWMRVGYPFELEWLEGAMVDHVRTILAGRPLYAKPSLSFIPLTYTPAYFYLAAALTKILGVGFLPLRLISIAASLGLLIVIGRLAAREAQDVRAGVLAAGVFAAMFGWTDGWLDLARNDSLFLLLAFLAITVLRDRTSTAGAVAAGALISLSFLVKQTGLIVAIPLAVYSARRGWRACAGFAGTITAIVVVTTIVFDRAFDGWYWYYVVAVPKQHPLALEMLWGFWRFDVIRPLPVAFIGSLAYLSWRLLRPEKDAPVFYVCGGAGLFAGALASRLHSLSYVNVVLAAYAWLSVMYAIAVFDGARAAREHGNRHARRLLPTVIYALALLQLMRLAYAPSSLVPTAADVETGRTLLRSLAAIPGDVFVPYHGYLPVLAGKASHAHAVVIADVIRGGTTNIERGLAAELESALRTQRFDAVVGVDTPTPVGRWLPLDRYYRPADRVIDGRSRFWRSEIWYLPRQGAPAR